MPVQIHPIPLQTRYLRCTAACCVVVEWVKVNKYERKIGKMLLVGLD